MTSWKIVALVGPLFFVAYQALSKIVPKGTSIFLLNAYASFIGMVVMLTLHMAIAQEKGLRLSSKQLLLAVGIGVLISLGNFAIIKAYSLGAPQSTFTVLFYVALISYGVVVGALVWNESINLKQVAGIGLSVAGLIVVARYRA